MGILFVSVEYSNIRNDHIHEGKLKFKSF